MDDEKVVIFELAGESYGVNVTQVQSIIPMQNIVTVPGTPTFVRGVINLRGAVIPVVDLSTRFGLSFAANAKKQVIVITEMDSLQIGLIVDRVTEVATLTNTAIEPPSPLLSSIDNTYLRGIGKIKEEPTILLDLCRIFSLQERQTLAQAA